MMYMCCSVKRFILLRASLSLFPKWMRDTFGSLGVKNSPWYPEVVSKTRPWGQTSVRSIRTNHGKGTWAARKVRVASFQ